MVIVLIGVAFYAGIKEAVPKIRRIQADYYWDTNLMDLKLLSTLGFDDEDIEAIKESVLVDEAVGSYSKFVLVGEDVVKVHSLDEDVNKVKLVAGRMPTNKEECLADASFYEVGDVIEISEELDDSGEGNLTVTEFKVVGTINSSLYTGTDYGSADIGVGKLRSYLFVRKEVFDYEAYTEVYVGMVKTNSDVPYAKSYSEKLVQATEDLEKRKGDWEERRKQKLIDSLANNWQLGESVRGGEIPEVEWYILEREDVVTSYKILENQYEEVETIADVIPIFFILIVVLMTSNTMARMIVEERGEMGTFSSLGVTNVKIILNYLLYVLTSTIWGVFLGFILGTRLLPQLVYGCFPVVMPEMNYSFDWSMFLVILVVAVIVMSLVTIFSCLKELWQKPAYLLRPVAPKSGKKIWLERVKFIWNNMSFSWKVTMRNISRYKKRGIMTLVGTAGCTFLILIGFAIKDSVNGVGDKQYTELFKYDNLIVLNDEVKAINELDKLLEGLVKEEVLLKQMAYKVVGEERQLDTYLVVSEKGSEYFENYFVLRDEESGKKLELSDEGVIITPRIAEVFGVQEGDVIVLEDLDQKAYEVEVRGICENYVSNYVYMSAELYEQIWGEEISYNKIVSLNEEEEEVIANKLLASSSVVSVNFSSDLLETANNGISGLNNIVVLLVIISSLLAFAVLYNLTSISISERIREIATLKVLGFKDGEANEYVYRETMVMVILGMVGGLLITPVLHNYIIDLLEADNMIFLREIKRTSYLYASLLTLSFAVIMQVITYFKLKKVDMIESLKSVE